MNYKDVNYNKIESIGKTKATVKTNNTTFQLPPFTKADGIPLMRLKWIKRFGVAVNATTENIKIRKLRMADTEKKIRKLKKEFKDVFFDNTEIKTCR